MTTSFLEEILAHKRAETALQRAQQPLAAVQAAAARAPAPLDFIAGLRRAESRPALIAEIKRRSPSRGALAADLDPLRLARIYQQNGAACISVLTDERYFGGSLEHLRSLAAQPERLPLLRKDFICDPYQVYQARAAGADAALLIVAALPADLLAELHALTESLGMAALVEVHTDDELEQALALRPRLIGINNRDLHSFTVSLATTERLCSRLPPEVCGVAESGIHSPEDVRRLAAIRRPAGVHGRPGVDAILVGEALVTAVDIAAQTRSLARALAPHWLPPDASSGGSLTRREPET